MGKPMSDNSKTRVVVGIRWPCRFIWHALLFKATGLRCYRHLHNWTAERKWCLCSYRRLQSVNNKTRRSNSCRQIGIYFLFLSTLRKEYWDRVFEIFPCWIPSWSDANQMSCVIRKLNLRLLCYDLGADYLSDRALLRRNAWWGMALFICYTGVDNRKDQTYFLKPAVTRATSTMFTLDHLEKHEVRRLAEEAGLAAAKKKDSTGICFIGRKEFQEFLSNYLWKPGEWWPWVDEYGEQHRFVVWYTIRSTWWSWNWWFQEFGDNAQRTEHRLKRRHSCSFFTVGVWTCQQVYRLIRILFELCLKNF